MTRAAVVVEIDRLDALSRTRELTNTESNRLQKLITVERRYLSGRRAEAIDRPVPTKPTQPAIADILARLDLALDRIATDGMEVRAIYLDRADLISFLAAQPLIARPLAHRGNPVREVTGSGRSRIYSDRGIARAVPRTVGFR